MDEIDAVGALIHRAVWRTRHLAHLAGGRVAVGCYSLADINVMADARAGRASLHPG